MPEEARSTKSERRQLYTSEPDGSELKKRRPWHAPGFSILEVKATNGGGGGGGGGGGSHCWNRWQCS